MSDDRYERIRAALAMGPTPESWAQDIDGDAAYAMFCCQSAAEAAFIVACDPDTIRALLEERDALAAENARLREDARVLRRGNERLAEALREVADDLDDARIVVAQARAALANGGEG